MSETEFEKAHREFSDLKEEARRLQGEVAQSETMDAGADAGVLNAIATYEHDREAAIASAKQVCNDDVTVVKNHRVVQLKRLQSLRDDLEAVRKKLEKRGGQLRDLLNDDIRNQ